MGKLTDIQLRNWIKAATPVAKSDGGGLTFTLSSFGTASWVLRYRHGTRAKEITLGRYPDLSLTSARKLAAEKRVSVSQGVDVAAAKRTEKIDAKNARTVNQLAEEYFADLKKRGKSDKTIRWHHSAYLKRKFGHRCLNEIKPREILDFFQKISDEKPSTARAVLGTFKRMYDFAIARQVIDINPAAQIKPGIFAPKAVRQRHLTPEELSRLLQEINNPEQGLSKPQQIAIKLLVLTLCRKTEVTEMQWSEYDESSGLWSLPGARTKNTRVHLIQLPRQATKALAEMKAISRSPDWVFPGNSSNKPMGATTLNERLTRSKHLGIAHWRIHDLRRTGSTMLHEMGYPPHIIERALNHVQDGIGGVYNKAQWLTERAQMLQQWANYLEALEAGATLSPYEFSRKSLLSDR